MRIAAPKVLWLLILVVGPLIAFLWWAWRKRQQLITQFISARLLGHLKVGVSPSRQKARMAMIVAAVVLVIFALARPQWGVTREEARQRGLDIIVAVDTSNSMLAEDVSPNRLARAKLAALDLMRRAKTDRMGLIAFAGDAFLECPLTLDDAAFSQSVNALDTTTISQGGTAIGSAIDEARKAFAKESDNHKVLVLMTDGEDHDSDAVSAAQTAAKDGMVVFTIGIGSPQGELLRIRNERGELDYIRDDQGQPVKSSLDEDLLQKIAKDTKGFYLQLQGTKTIDYLYDQGIAPLPKSERAVKSFQNYHDRFQWPLAAAMALLLLEVFLPDRSSRRSKRPDSTGGPTPPHTMIETAAIILLLMLPVAAWGSPQSALREYNAGQYDAALKDFNQAVEQKTNDPRLHFNTGAAAYQSHQLDQAVKEFNSALGSSQDPQLQQHAYYNLGNSMYRLGQQSSDSEKKQEAWTNAIRNYDLALKLNQQDADAKFNQEFVKKQLEELKKQQSQSQQGKDNKDNKDKKNKDKQDQKQQSGKDQQDKQNNQSQDQQNKNDDKSKQGQNSQDNKKETAKQKSEEEKQKEQEQPQSEAQKQKQDQQQQQQQAEQNQASNDSKEKQEEAQREAAMMAAGEMTPQQAKQLLDAQKDDEHVFQLAPPNKNVSQTRSFKNW